MQEIMGQLVGHGETEALELPGLGIRQFADEDFAGGIDAALGIGSEHESGGVGGVVPEDAVKAGEALIESDESGTVLHGKGGEPSVVDIISHEAEVGDKAVECDILSLVRPQPAVFGSVQRSPCQNPINWVAFHA